MRSKYYIFCIFFLGIFIFSGPVRAEDASKKETVDTQELMDRIEILEKQLKKMEDENKARKSLEVTEQEKTEKDKEALQAVSREYTLSPKGTLSIDYSVNYAFSPAQTITSDPISVRNDAAHTITHTIYTSYSLFDNLTTSVSFPIQYRYNKMGTDDKIDQSDLGDVSLSFAFQPPKDVRVYPLRYKIEIPSLPYEINGSYSLSSTFPTGRSPYKINQDTELSTGSGVYGLSFGGSFSKKVDPVVMFWSLSTGYNFDVKGLNMPLSNTNDNSTFLVRVKPGSSFSGSMGLAYALSYANSINMSFNYTYTLSPEYFFNTGATSKPGDSVGATLAIGTGFVISPKTYLSISFSYSLTSAGFTVGGRLPFDFAM